MKKTISFTIIFLLIGSGYAGLVRSPATGTINGTPVNLDDGVFWTYDEADDVLDVVTHTPYYQPVASFEITEFIYGQDLVVNVSASEFFTSINTIFRFDFGAFDATPDYEILYSGLDIENVESDSYMVTIPWSVYVNFNPSAQVGESEDFHFSIASEIGSLITFLPTGTYQVDDASTSATLSDAVPEPATAGMLALSALLIAAYRRIRKSYGC